MDPIMTAIVAALAQGVTVGAAEAGKKAVVDAYGVLKSVLRERFGTDSDLVDAVEKLEGKPDSSGRRQTLCEEIEAAKANKDQEILRLAQDLLDKVNAQPGGQQIIQNIQNVYGDYSAVAGPGGSATVNARPEE